jgi:hypothetical protein
MDTSCPLYAVVTPGAQFSLLTEEDDETLQATTSICWL